MNQNDDLHATERCTSLITVRSNVNVITDHTIIHIPASMQHALHVEFML